MQSAKNFQSGGAEGQKKMVYLLSTITLGIFIGLLVYNIIRGVDIVSAIVGSIGFALYPLISFFICRGSEE